MFFTQEDYRKIERWLQSRAVKDSDFDKVSTLNTRDQIIILHNDENKRMFVNCFIKQLSAMGLSDFYNVSNYCNNSLTLEEAICAIPLAQRKLGLTITFKNKEGNWGIYQFLGEALTQWQTPTLWEDVFMKTIHAYLYAPDEEDITSEGVTNKILKFKDKDYEPLNFSGKGRKMLRKAVVGSFDAYEDDEDHFINLLTQQDITNTNTIYIIQYDFDLDNRTISIPANCTLEFRGGTINNGNIFLQNTKLQGILNLEEIGTANIQGSFSLGQILVFNDEDKTVLKWWNGNKWVAIETIDLSSFTEDIEGLKTTVSQHTVDIENIQDSIGDLEESLKSYIKTITVNGETINPVLGNVTLPDYHEHTLTIQDSDNNILGSYNGSENKLINIPIGGKTLTIKQGENTLGSYNGTEPVTINIPISTGGSGEVDLEAIKTALLPWIEEQLGNYLKKNTSETQTVQGYVIFDNGAGKS